MTKNGIALSVLAVILAAAYVRYFTDWFTTQTIQIIPQIRPGRASAIPGNPGADPVCPVSFAFDGKYKLTSVKVVVASDLATNRFPTPLWHLTSDSNSAPTKAIVYGYPIKGMKPAVERSHPEPLEASVSYVLMVEAESGKIRGQTNFHTAVAVQPN